MCSFSLPREKHKSLNPSLSLSLSRSLSAQDVFFFSSRVVEARGFVNEERARFAFNFFHALFSRDIWIELFF
jgi:hypothetical protein